MSHAAHQFVTVPPTLSPLTQGDTNVPSEVLYLLKSVRLCAKAAVDMVTKQD